MTNKTNPLANHFRQPKLYMKLPSGGLFNTDKDLDFPENKEIAIFPMTAKDEIMMKNPDALLNGEAVLQVIKSCVPSALEPRELTNIDVDALLMGIQSATYGDDMEVSTKCQYCEKELTGSTSIQEALDQIDPLEEVTIANRFTGQKTTMPCFAAAVYDVIIGAEMAEQWDLVRKGLDWFKRYFAEQYMVVLD